MNLIRSPFPSLRRGLIALAAISSALLSQQSRPVNPGNPSTIEDFQAVDASREPYQRATDLLAALQVSTGDWVADVGARAGYYSMRLADLVGAEGRVFAEDLAICAWLNARSKAFNLHNVEVVKGEADDPKLPADRLTVVLIVDSYHHFTNYPAMVEKILHELKPGGRLAIADYSSTEHRSLPRADQLKLHEIDPALVRAEVEHAGFQVVRYDDPFVKWRPGVGNTRASATDLWLMLAIRPK
jgi:predicted methyltransferase